jgi:hypothetical protein
LKRGLKEHLGVAGDVRLRAELFDFMEAKTKKK